MSASSARPLVRLVLLRHGEAEGNRELRYLGSGAAGDVALTARGAAQARQAAQALAGYPLVAIYASPLRRAWLTANALADATGLAPQPAPDLREQDYGAWEGLTRAEAQARNPALHAAWEAGDDGAPPGGESQSQLRARVVACADALAARHLASPPTPPQSPASPSGQAQAGAVADTRSLASPDTPIAPTPMIALVSHVGPIKALIAAALGLAPAEARRLLARMWLDPASVCVVDWWPATTRGDAALTTPTTPTTPGDVAPDAPTLTGDGAALMEPRGLLRVFNATDHLDPPPRWRG